MSTGTIAEPMVSTGNQGGIAGVEVNARASGQELLEPGALSLLADLHRRFEAKRQDRLFARRERQAFYDEGGLPDFREDTCDIREEDWRIAPLPPALLDRRVEITGPTDPKMVINALNSGANCFMADFEDSNSPTWDNLLSGQRALKQAVAGTILWFALDLDDPGARKRYELRPFEEQAVLMMRPRGWHLNEKHVHVDGSPISASLFDVGVFLFHNAAALAAKDRGPYLYLPKLQSMEEAVLWEEVLAHAEHVLGLPEGQIRVTVLIETLPAAFEMDEILYALRGRIAGLNCGRWDYIFSYIKTLRHHRDRVLPERGQVGMTQPFLHSYSDLLIQTCHRRGAHAMGGMAAQIPVSGTDSENMEANQQALAKVCADKWREVEAGFDGTWIAHPGLLPMVKQIFDAHMPTANQHHVLRADFVATRADLLLQPSGTITRAGFEGNVEVCVRYLAAWLDGCGCVPIHGLMEDAATAEIARAQLWQWLHHGTAARTDAPAVPALRLADAPHVAIDFTLFEKTLQNLRCKIEDIPRLPGIGRINDAMALLDRLTRSDDLEEFLTLPAYEQIA